MTAPTQNFKFVNNTTADMREFEGMLAETYKTGEVPEDFADIFKVNILKAYNPDGSDRMVVNWA